MSYSCAERQHDELEALAAIFGPCVRVTEGCAPLGCSVQVSADSDRAAVLTATLPSDYPLAPPRLSVSCPWAGVSALERMTSALEATAHASCVAEDGQEVLTELVRQLESMVLEAAADADAAREAAAAASSPPADGSIHEAVLKIDHMNSPSTYQRFLARWASALGLSARCLVPSPPRGDRMTGVYLYLAGDDGAIGSFLHRLRTELVDVDRAGRPCCERMATVLCRRRKAGLGVTGGASAEDGRVTAATPAGWEVEEYTGEQGLDRALDALGVLHVGVGSSRFGASPTA
jgi:hypothetical protein